MLRKFVGALIGAYVAGTVLLGHANADGLDIKKFSTQIRSSTVQLAIPGGDSCSGTIVASDPVVKDSENDKIGDIKTLILTAEHCVEGHSNSTFKVRIPQWDGGETFNAIEAAAEVVKQGSVDGNDMAILRLRDKTQVWVKQIANIGYAAKLMLGEPVYSAGYPLGREFALGEGRYSSTEEYTFSDDGTPVPFIRATATISPGNSGGGLFHLNAAGNFELVGVADRGAMGDAVTTQFGLWATTKQMVKFLNSYDKDLFPVPVEKK